MPRAIRLKLFVLHFSVVDAYQFFLAKDVHDLFDRCDLLACDSSDDFEEAVKDVPYGFHDKRRNAAVDRAIRNFKHKIIARGSKWVDWDWHHQEKYAGRISWKSYRVSNEEIAFLRTLGLIEEKGDVDAALKAMREQIEVRV